MIEYLWKYKASWGIIHVFNARVSRGVVYVGRRGMADRQIGNTLRGAGEGDDPSRLIFAGDTGE